MFENADLIHRYTRADALRDGVLIDVTATAKEAGFKYPVALTATSLPLKLPLHWACPSRASLIAAHNRARLNQQSKREAQNGRTLRVLQDGASRR